MRRFLLWLHRWFGLAIALFLVVVGLTGSVLAFRQELDIWLNPELLTVSLRDAPVVDPFELRDKVAARYPDNRFDWVMLSPSPGRSVAYTITAKIDGEDVSREIFFDPYTGNMLGERLVGRVSLAKDGLISFLYRLHYALAFPAALAELGGYILGVVALAWTIDCFVSFYLTLPLTRREAGKGSRKSWLSRWKPAWLIKFGAGEPSRVCRRPFGLSHAAIAGSSICA